jgi:ankyrin repeat protein
MPSVDGPYVAVRQWITLQAQALATAIARGEPAALAVLRLAEMQAELENDRLDLDQLRLAVAKDHWYLDWADAVAHGHDTVDTRFEAAADAIHEGDLDSLRRLLDEEPALVRMRSPFPHHQTLLHHLAANGIETERQRRSPPNAVEVMRLLIERGADPDATCDSYGGGPRSTTMCLLVSSVHPYVAGVQVALVEELCRNGARVNGIHDDNVPLWTAISFGYTDAAEALARCGARVDNLCLAAALGDLEAVRWYFGASGSLDAGRAPPARMGADGPTLSPDLMVEYALIWAAAHGRRAVVELLLTKDPDLGVTEPLFRSTALGMARHRKKDDIIALLEPLTSSA